MFQRFGAFVARTWPGLICVWVAAFVVLALIAPRWQDVTDHGETSVLPDDAPSNIAQRFRATAFPQEPIGSSVVIVLRRRDEPLTDADRDFIRLELEPALDELAFRNPAGLEREQGVNATPTANRGAAIVRVQTLNTKGSGALMVSSDRRATLALVELNTGFQDRRGWALIAAIEETVAKLRRANKAPQGLEIELTGSAVINRDVVELERESARRIEIWTVILVVGLLLGIYQALLLAIIPLVTVFVAVQVSLKLLALLAGAGILTLSDGLRIYITVLAYGAGVDYCLFLTARYREELQSGASTRESLAQAIGKVGDALTASAATVIAGIGMLAFCEFGRYFQAGIAIPLSLALVLLCTLTFTAALLFLAGRWAFWPRQMTAPAQPGRHGRLARLMQSRSMSRFWEWVGQGLYRRPATIFLLSIAVLMPFAALAVVQYNHWDYGLVSSLPGRVGSVRATEIVAEHFSRGMTAPVTMLLRDDGLDFRSSAGRQAVAELANRIAKRREELRITDVRSQATPTGITAAADLAQKELQALDRSAQLLLRERAIAHYISEAPETEGHVTRLDLVMADDPLSHVGIEQLRQIERALREELPESLRAAQVYSLGPTAGLRDLQEVTTRDLRRIELLVPAVVLLILLVLLREVLVSIYLIVSVLFSYLATLGMTYVVFWAIDPAGFYGLDWKVPILLFAILVAVGEDYNIFLMTRVREERAVHGPVHGVIAALVKTGGIISSCGIIMAGTFVALLTGALNELKQLGFALAVGVLLDTLVVRPILVPAFLLILERWKRQPVKSQPPVTVGN